MQNIVIDKPYQFVPPYHGTFWVSLLLRIVPGHLRRTYGIERISIGGDEQLRRSLDEGHAVLLTPNHCRDYDPVVLGMLSRKVGHPFFLMASWHIFMQGRLMAWLLRRAGAFSIYREGMDRAAVNMACDILEQGRRPLVIFPEGVVSRTNDRLNVLMDGTALIARTAAKRRAKATAPGKVVVHPIAIRYKFLGDLETTLRPELDAIESRLTWRPQRHLPMIDRVFKLAEALLSLKEVEYLGQPQTGTIARRLHRLIDLLLTPLETEWLKGEREDGVVARVKRIRSAILPDLVKGDLSEEERQRRWKQLADVYLAQQLWHYPPDYIAGNPTPERILEIVERIQEDMTDVPPVHRPLSASISVGPAIEVKPRDDDLMSRVEHELRQLLGIPAAHTTPVSQTAAAQPA